VCEVVEDEMAIGFNFLIGEGDLVDETHLLRNITGQITSGGRRRSNSRGSLSRWRPQAESGSALLSSLVASTEFVEAEWSRTDVGAVAEHLLQTILPGSRIEGHHNKREVLLYGQLAPPCLTSYVSRNSRSSGSLGILPPFDRANSARVSYEANAGHLLATTIGTSPYTVQTCPRT
jgi:hypothetical protein